MSHQTLLWVGRQDYPIIHIGLNIDEKMKSDVCICAYVCSIKLVVEILGLTLNKRKVTESNKYIFTLLDIYLRTANFGKIVLSSLSTFQTEFRNK